MTPSANDATSAAWRPSDTPSPTHTARSGAAARVRATSVSAASPTVARVPVTPLFCGNNPLENGRAFYCALWDIDKPPVGRKVGTYGFFITDTQLKVFRVVAAARDKIIVTYKG